MYKGKPWVYRVGHFSAQTENEISPKIRSKIKKNVLAYELIVINTDGCAQGE